VPDVLARRSFARLLEGSGRLLALSLGLSVGQSLALVPIGLLIRHVFDSVLPHGDRTGLVLCGVAVVVLFGVSAGLGLASRYLMLRSTKAAVVALRERLLDRIQTLPRTWLDRADTAQLHSTIVQDSERIDLMANALLGIVLPAAIVATALVASLAFFDLRLVALLVVLLPPLVVLGRRLNRRATALLSPFQRSFDVFSARILSNLRAGTTIVAHGAEEHEAKAGRMEIADLAEKGRSVAWVWQASLAVQTTTAVVGGMLVLVVGGLAVIGGDLTLGTLLSFFGVLGLARGQVNAAVTWLPYVYAGRESLARLERLLDLDAPPPYTGTRRLRFLGGVSVEHVTFGYGDTPVVRDLSLSVAPGEWVALTGSNGAGKSTLVALLLAMYKPGRGRLCADGVPYAELDVRDLRRQVGVLLQDPVLFRGSVRDNIAYGAPESTDEAIRAAAAAATADAVIAALPEGYATEVGDNGELLSGGQRQRIVLARALVRKPPLIVLDEPSSHLDAGAVAALLRNLAQLPWSPAVLLITHDPAVSAAADRVVELREGRIVANRLAAPA
jgi:ABC-type multidrug transport system fused ATPase/permease subunit